SDVYLRCQDCNGRRYRPEVLEVKRRGRSVADVLDMTVSEAALFFSEDLDDVVAAKRLCLTCPVRTDCLDEAVARGERYGVWGGHLFEDGRIVLTKRRQGRPPRVPRPEDAFPDIDVPEAHRALVRTASVR
ncbi:MAG: WhiB family transcriptional regulator, partial [Actinomycetes bacterium]